MAIEFEENARRDRWYGFKPLGGGHVRQVGFIEAYDTRDGRKYVWRLSGNEDIGITKSLDEAKRRIRKGAE